MMTITERVLEAIMRQPDLSRWQISRRLDVLLPAVEVAIRELEKAGHIEREEPWAKGDHRNVVEDA